MEEKNSKEELINIYKELYFNRGNNEKFFDCKVFIENYKLYLSLFFDNESTFYGDIEFLFYAVDGFNYFYRNLFGNEEYDVHFINNSLLKHDSLLRDKNKNNLKENDDYTDSDVILVFSLKLAITFRDMNLIEEYYEELQKIFYNSFVIEKYLKGCGKDGMEDRKCYS